MKLIKRKKTAIFLLIIACLISIILPIDKVRAEDKKKYVLYISSYSYAWESVPLQIQGIQDALADACVINYEFMDTKNVSYSEDYKEYFDILKYKLSQRPAYDGVVVGDDAALKFVQRYKDELFPNTPIAFTGIDDVENGKVAAKDPYICGVTESVDYLKNIEIAKKMCPNATKIVFINDRKENGVGIQKQIEQFAECIDGYEVSYLISADYTKEELEAELNKLDDTTILFMVSMGQGKNRIIYSEDERMDIIANNTKIPIFRVSSVNFPEIFLGGHVVDHQKSAYLAGNMIRDTLEGKKMEEEELIENTPAVYCFNQEVMEEYNLSMNILPKDTVIVYPIPTFMSQHYLEIINAFVILTLGLLIIIIRVSQRNLKTSKANALMIQNQKDELENALQAKTDFLSRMSHEMRTPLNSILGCAHLASVNNEKKLDVSQDISMIDQAGNFLLNLINDILDVSRIEANKIELHKEWCSPRKTMQGIINMMIPIMEEKKIHFVLPKLNEKIDCVEWYVDPRRIEQTIINLLNNAAKFTPEGGTVTFDVKNQRFDDKYSVDSVVVSDTGCGMSEEFISHIGEAFHQEKNEYSDKVTGSGLGLFIVKKMVEIMGGKLHVESEIGKGSTFDFTIKYEYRLKKEEIDEKKIEKDVHIEGMKVLYAEDNAMNQIVGKRLLENEGVIVTMVSDGAEAIKAFETSTENEYHTILMDMRMPVMNGLDATEYIRNTCRKDSNIPIIALSADAIPEEVEKAKQKGLTEYLTKPINPKELYHTLEKLKK